MLELILLFAFCVLLGLGCLGVMGWVLLGSVETGVELIFLLIVCLSLAAVFFGMAAWIAWHDPVRQLWRSRVTKTAPETQKTTSLKQEGTAKKEVHKSSS